MLNFRLLIHGPGPSFNLPYNLPTLTYQSLPITTILYHNCGKFDKPLKPTANYLYMKNIPGIKRGSDFKTIRQTGKHTDEWTDKQIDRCYQVHYEQEDNI